MSAIRLPSTLMDDVIIHEQKGNTVEPSTSNSTGETNVNGVDGTIQFATLKIDS